MPELTLNDLEIGERVTARLERRAIQHMQERTAALDVAEEIEAEPLPLARTLNEAGYVGDGNRESPDCTTPRFGCRVVNG